METENSENKKSYVRRKKFWKFWILMICINIGFAVLVGRLFWIQVVKSDEYREKARRQHESKVTLSAQRGNIYDRNGKLLASTVNSISIAVDPTVLINKDAVCEVIQRSLGVSATKLKEKISNAKGSFVWLVRGVNPDRITDLRNMKEKNRGLLLIEEPTRHYYYSNAGAQIIGCTDIDNRGLSGIELQWDSTLKGRSGSMIMYRDGLGRLRPSADLPQIPAIHGYSVQLTIDIELQRIAEFELMQGVLNSQAESGTVIALEPRTGEVLALASYPGFNPNNSETFSVANMRNRAITDAFEPGSTFKMITAAAALEEQIIDTSDRFNGFNGELQYAEYTIRDVHPLGIVPFSEAMIQSSNIVLSNVAAKIPDTKFYKYMRDFGFGIVSGIDIPGEISGRIPRANQMNNTAKRFAGFGYGLMCTPIQIANAYSTIANGGVMMKPYVVKSIFDENGDKIYDVKPEKIRRVVSEKTAATVNDLLYKVVERGTGALSRISGVKISGKTGTAQQLVDGVYNKADYTASYVGYYPSDNPRVVMIVVLDKPRTSIYGGSVAAPIFKNIALRWLSVSPSVNAVATQKNNKDSVFVPELKGLSLDDGVGILENIGLRHSSNIAGGIVTDQIPRPGSRLPRGSSVNLILSIGDSTGTKALKKVNLVGLSLRRAIALLQERGIKAVVKGRGKVVSQQYQFRSNGEQTCILICQ